MHGACQQDQMGLGFVVEKAGQDQQPLEAAHGRSRRGVRGFRLRRSRVGEVEVAQGLHFAQALGRHARVQPLAAGRAAVAPDGVRLEDRAVRRAEGARIVEIAEVRGPDGGMLCAEDRPVPGLMRGLGQHALPGAVFQREQGPALRPGAVRIALEGPVLKAALQAAPAPEGFGPVALGVVPEIEPGTGEVKGRARVFFQAQAGPAEAQMPPQGCPEIAVAQKFFQIVEGKAVFAFLAETVAQFAALGEGKLGRGKADEQPAHELRSFAPGHRVKNVVQLFPVAGAEAPQTGGVHVQVGKIGGNGGGGLLPRCGRQTVFFFPDAGQLASYGPPPVRVAGRGPQGRGAGVVDPPQQALRGLEAQPRLVAFHKEAARHGAEIRQRVAQGGVAAAEPQGREAFLVHEAFQGAQLVDGVEIGRHLGVALVEQGAPPHGRAFPGFELFLQFLAAHTQAAQIIGPGHVFGADRQQVRMETRGQGDSAFRHFPGAPVGDGLAQTGGGRRYGRLLGRFHQQHQFFHGCASVAASSRAARTAGP